MLALADGSLTGCCWYLQDTAREIYGLCDFENYGDTFERYRYSVTGGFDVREVYCGTGCPETQITGGMTLGNGPDIPPPCVEVLTEDVSRISVGVGGYLVFNHALGVAF